MILNLLLEKLYLDLSWWWWQILRANSAISLFLEPLHYFTTETTLEIAGAGAPAEDFLFYNYSSQLVLLQTYLIWDLCCTHLGGLSLKQETPEPLYTEANKEAPTNTLIWWLSASPRASVRDKPWHRVPEIYLFAKKNACIKWISKIIYYFL